MREACKLATHLLTTSQKHDPDPNLGAGGQNEDAGTSKFWGGSGFSGLLPTQTAVLPAHMHLNPPELTTPAVKAEATLAVELNS